jgi:hypothetical protein
MARYLLLIALLLGPATPAPSAQQASSTGAQNNSTSNVQIGEKVSVLKSLQANNTAVTDKRIAEYNRDPSQWQAVPLTLDAEIANYKRNIFASASELQIKRLADSGVSHTDIASLQAAVTVASRSDRDEDRAHAFDMVYRTAKQNNISSLIMFSAKAPGAVVRYQDYSTRIANGPSLTVGGTTSTSAKMPIGLYYFWVERNGVPTSDRNRLVVITDPQETVDLDEQGN